MHKKVLVSSRNTWLFFSVVNFFTAELRRGMHAKIRKVNAQEKFCDALHNTWLFFSAVDFFTAELRRGIHAKIRKVNAQKPLRFFAKHLAVFLCG